MGASMMASLLVPLVVSSVSMQTPRPSGVLDAAIPVRVGAFREIAASGPSPSAWMSATLGSLPASPDLDRVLQVGWIAGSTALLLAVVAGGVQVGRRRRRWQRGNMTGVPVQISQDTGPAVVGLLHPCIVVPRWLLQCPADVQALVIAHEQSHLEARDSRLVTIAIGLLVCMPWNLPLWWQLRRLRFAVEIDCDARVLRRGYDVSRYGETLIAVGERQSAAIANAAAMSEPRSLLELRIRHMLRKRTRYTRALAGAVAGLGIGFAVGAAEIDPPTNVAGGKSASQEHAADTGLLDSHIGFYQLNDNTVLAVTRTGRQLNAQVTGQPSVPMFARSNTEFSYKDKSISFITGHDGRTTSLILHQYGMNLPMTRIDATVAQRIASVGGAQRYRPKPDRVGAFIILQ
jgi:bla regulator protein blaR1